MGTSKQRNKHKIVKAPFFINNPITDVLRIQIWHIWGVYAVSDSNSWSIFFFLLFHFWFWKTKSFFLPSNFLSLWVRSTLLLFLLFLFRLKSHSALYHLDSFYKKAFCSPMIVHFLSKIYNYIILKYVVQIYWTRKIINSTYIHTYTISSVGAHI